MQALELAIGSSRLRLSIPDDAR